MSLCIQNYKKILEIVTFDYPQRPPSMMGGSFQDPPLLVVSCSLDNSEICFKPNLHEIKDEIDDNLAKSVA